MSPALQKKQLTAEMIDELAEKILDDRPVLIVPPWANIEELEKEPCGFRLIPEQKILDNPAARIEKLKTI